MDEVWKDCFINPLHSILMNSKNAASLDRNTASSNKESETVPLGFKDKQVQWTLRQSLLIYKNKQVQLRVQGVEKTIEDPQAYNWTSYPLPSISLTVCQWSPPLWQIHGFHRPYLETALPEHPYLEDAISFFFFISSASSYPPTDGSLLLPHPQTIFLLWAWQAHLQIAKLIVLTLHMSYTSLLF